MTEIIVSTLPELARTINRAQANVENLLNEAVENAVIAGQALIEAKAQVKHGEWQDWISENCSIADRTARSYMRLARELPKLDYEKRQSVAVLPLRDAIAALANPKPDPDPLYCEAMRLIDDVKEWAAKGFPGASLEDLARIAGNHEPEKNAAKIRMRAERNCGVLLSEGAA